MKVLRLETVKKHKKQLLFAIPIVVMFFISFSIFVSATEYTDPADDLRCFTESDLIHLQDYWGEGEYPEHPSEFAEGILDMWKLGTMSATPHCIDMLKVIVEEVGTDIKLTIEVKGSFLDCENILFLIWGNCTGGEYVATLLVTTNMGGNLVGFFKYTNEDGTTSQGYAHMESSSVDFHYPNREQDCQLMILSVAVDESGDLMCMDIFPNSLYETVPGTGGNSGDDPYVGLDPVTNFFADLAQLLFGFMCGRISFFLFISILIVGFKVMIDRKHPIIRAGGGVGLAFCCWLDVAYMLSIDVVGGELDPIFGSFNLVGTLDMIIALFFIVCICFQYLNNFNYSDDNTWTYAVAYAIMIIEAALFMTPFWFYECAGQPTLTVVVLIIVVTASFIVFGLTEKYSKGRLE